MTCTEWTSNDVVSAGAVLASPDAGTRTAALLKLAHEGVTIPLSDSTARVVVGRVLVDSLGSLATLDETPRNFGSLIEFVESAFPSLRSATQLRMQPWLTEFVGHCHMAQNGKTFGLSAFLARSGAIDAAEQIVLQDLRLDPCTGGGAAAVISALRDLNGRTRHAQLRFHALESVETDSVDWDFEEVFLGSYLSAAAIFDRAERLAALCCADARGGGLVYLLNARTAMLLDRYLFGSRELWLDEARDHIRTAWCTRPNESSFNLQRRLADLSGDLFDAKIARRMESALGSDL